MSTIQEPIEEPIVIWCSCSENEHR